MNHTITWNNSKPIVTFASGYVARITNLLAKGDTNPKLAKGEKGYLIRSLSLSPSTYSGIGNVCAFSSPGCEPDNCLFGQGRAGAWNRTDMLSPIAYARIARNILWHLERQWFLDRLHLELDNHAKLADRYNLIPASRLNMFSDLPWERFNVPQEHPGTIFWDYSKWPTRYGAVLPNYWLTFSRSELNEDTAIDILRNAGNVAVVFADSRYKSPRQIANWKLPTKWHGFRVQSGDSDDKRFNDSRGRIHGRVIGLKLKTSSHAKWHNAVDTGFPVLVN